mmetsp:Transcript_7436/g.17699  ORF Transcript_7436/g.17699 Transcript_7436/m.17699 type:complete len:232 (-) Transcript_7436:410-1105(-)
MTPHSPSRPSWQWRSSLLGGTLLLQSFRAALESDFRLPLEPSSGTLTSPCWPSLRRHLLPLQLSSLPHQTSPARPPPLLKQRVCSSSSSGSGLSGIRPSDTSSLHWCSLAGRHLHFQVRSPAADFAGSRPLPHIASRRSTRSTCSRNSRRSRALPSRTISAAGGDSVPARRSCFFSCLPRRIRACQHCSPHTNARSSTCRHSAHLRVQVLSQTLLLCTVRSHQLEVLPSSM